MTLMLAAFAAIVAMIDVLLAIHCWDLLTAWSRGEEGEDLG